MAVPSEPESQVKPATDEILAIARVRRLLQTGKAREIREQAQLSLTEIAKALEVAPATVLRWEAGERTPRGELALAYGRLLGDLEAGVAA